ncbi:MAG TPA: hypothetical protein VGR24_00625 [bacterium]|nr:hypothetical protein [bacterium]
MKPTSLAALVLALLVGLMISPGPVTSAPAPVRSFKPIIYRLDSDSAGYMEKVDYIYNLGIVSNDPNVLKAEYEAGYIQGRLQRNLLADVRDNLWDTYALVDPGTPKAIPPSKVELDDSIDALRRNYTYTLSYISKVTDRRLRQRMTRLVFRLLGIYHGAVRNKPQALKFDGTWLPTLDTFKANELVLNYQKPAVSFMDVYFINALADLMYVVDDEPPPSTRCSAFVKRTPTEIFLTHNSWFGYLDQSAATTYWINGSFLTVNALTPGNIGSDTDFGYNDKGIMFNETTLYSARYVPKIEALWQFFRATLAEQFASSLDEFYQMSTLELSGTYMNGYAIVDTKTREIGLVESSWKTSMYWKSSPKGMITVVTAPANASKEYDKQLFQPDVIIQVNFPASLQIRSELQAVENRPMRRAQFLARMGTVKDIETAKALITYTAPNEPLSIYGRWDLGFGTTPKPKTIPEGSIDAKAITASMTRYVRNLRGRLDMNSPTRVFWMKYGTPVFKGKPFIWSESQWKNQKLRDVPNAVTGTWQFLRAYIR